MTEEEWQDCADPERMWRVALRQVSMRRLLLCAAAWCRRAGPPGADHSWWAPVEAAEGYADGEASYADFSGTTDRLRTTLSHLMGPSGAADHPAQAVLMRDIVPSPSGALRFDPAWRTPDVVRLAEAAYEGRALPSGALDTARLAVLGDALEEAGCADEAVLSHCHAPGPHVRGCWVVDLALGKE